jgi:hypothetical protein
MAIFKATYTKNRVGAKASIRYIQHRPGKEGTRITRNLFGWDGLMGRYEAYRLIDEAAKGSHFFRFVISPDPKSEDIEKDLFLREITAQTMLRLEDRIQRQVQWIAAEHNDHTAHRHVHIVAIVPRRLQVQDFQLLRLAATEEALEQRRQRDLAHEQQAQLRERMEREEVQWERGY